MACELLKIFLGDSKTIRIQIEDDSTESGFYDLSDAQSFTLAISKFNSAAPLFTKSFASGDVIVDAPNGVIDLFLIPAETESIQWVGRCILQVRVVEAMHEYTVVHSLIETVGVLFP